MNFAVGDRVDVLQADDDTVIVSGATILEIQDYSKPDYPRWVAWLDTGYGMNTRRLRLVDSPPDIPAE